VGRPERPYDDADPENRGADIAGVQGLENNVGPPERPDEAGQVVRPVDAAGGNDINAVEEQPQRVGKREVIYIHTLYIHTPPPMYYLLACLMWNIFM